jgi:transposase-like protein
MPRHGDIDLRNRVSAPRDLERITAAAARQGLGRHEAIELIAGDIGMQPESLRRSWRMWTTETGSRRVPAAGTIERIREAARGRGWLSGPR